MHVGHFLCVQSHGVRHNLHHSDGRCSYRAPHNLTPLLIGRSPFATYPATARGIQLPRWCTLSYFNACRVLGFLIAPQPIKMGTVITINLKLLTWDQDHYLLPGPLQILAGSIDHLFTECLQSKGVTYTLVHIKCNIWYGVYCNINQNSNNTRIDEWIWSGIYLCIPWWCSKLCRCIHGLTFRLFQSQRSKILSINPVWVKIIELLVLYLAMSPPRNPFVPHSWFRSTPWSLSSYMASLIHFSFGKYSNRLSTHEITINFIPMKRKG